MKKHSLLYLFCTLFAMTTFADQPPKRFGTIDEFMHPGGRTRVIAHRGLSGIAPENTLIAMKKALDLGADMIEIDVTLTRDGHVVLLHDETLDRTTNGRGRALEVTLEEIRRLDAGSWFAAEYAGEKIPTLAEALDLVKGNILLNIEIKGEAVTETVEGGIVDKVLQLVRERNMLKEVVISSFEPRALLHARELSAEVKTASLFEDKIHRGQSPLEVMDAVQSNGFNLSRKEVNREIVEECHRHGRPVAVYTVNRKKGMRKLIALGVDAMFTDHPDRLLEVLDE